jgi:hypothetical protein
VAATRHAVEAILEATAARGVAWTAAQRERAAVDARSAEVALTWDAVTTTARPMDFPGYAYTREPSEVSGGTWIRYDRSRPRTWRVPVYEELRPDLVVRPPRAGYIVLAGHADAVARRLELHGIAARRLDAPVPAMPASVFRVRAAHCAPEPYEGRTRVSFEGGWEPASVTVAAGSLFVPIAQPRARLILHLLEPDAPDSFAAWGFFHTALQRQEYLEPYVAEAAARSMLQDPELRRAFEARLSAEPDFARNPGARLDFFYRRHASFDERTTYLPVLKIDGEP